MQRMVEREPGLISSENLIGTLFQALDRIYSHPQSYYYTGFDKTNNSASTVSSSPALITPVHLKIQAQ